MFLSVIYSVEGQAFLACHVCPYLSGKTPEVISPVSTAVAHCLLRTHSMFMHPFGFDRYPGAVVYSVRLCQ